MQPLKVFIGITSTRGLIVTVVSDLQLYHAPCPIVYNCELGENIACDKGFKKIAVISGIGVREYYQKNGYYLDGTYMTKLLPYYK